MDAEKNSGQPGAGSRVGAIPHGVEVLLKKASVDPEFRKLLLKERGEAARTIDLELTEAEREMLAHIPTKQLEQIIDSTKVRPEHKSAFLGSVGRIMLATIVAGAAFVTCVPTLGHTATAGISPDELRRMQTMQQSDANEPNNPSDPNVSEPNAAEPGQLPEALDDRRLPEGPRPRLENQIRMVTLGIRPDSVIELEVKQDDQK